MKKIFSFFAAILFAGSMMAESISITPASGFKSSYGSEAYTFTIGEVEFECSGVQYNQKNAPEGFASKQFIQFRKSSSGAGEFKNNTELSLKSITVATQNNKAFTLSAGTVSGTLSPIDKPAGTAGKYACKDNTGADIEADVTIYTFDVEGMKYFDILNGSNANYIAYVTIELGSAPDVAKPVISGETLFYKSTHVKISCVTDGATIYYTLDGSEPDPDDAGGSTNTYDASGINLVDNTIVTALAVKGSDRSEVASKTFTKATVMTVTQALDSLDKVSTIANAYVKGIISQVDSYNETYGSITYWISDDGTTANQLEVYGGLGLDGDQFVTENALQKGDKVTVFGSLKIYKSTKEFDKDNILVEFEEGTPTAIDNTAVDAKVVKTIENGQLVIIKNGVKYNAQGTQIR
jgi:hypothetical protein